MTASVHPTAVIGPGAVLSNDVIVGPLCVVGDEVTIGSRTRLIASCTILGPTRLGPDNTVHPYAVLGGDPQDRSYQPGGRSELEIGSFNVFREHVTIHRGTAKGDGVTRIGSHGLFMADSHVAHDASVGDHATLANGTLLGGHVRLGHHVTCGGHCAIAPFVRIGDGVFLAGGAMVERDIPPWVIAAGDRARVRTLNEVALARCNVPAPSRDALDSAFRLLFRSRTPLRIAMDQARSQLGSDPYVSSLLDFLEASRDLGERRRGPPRPPSPTS